MNLAETTVRPGDALTWRFMTVGTQPTPEPREATGDVPAPAAADDGDL